MAGLWALLLAVGVGAAVPDGVIEARARGSVVAGIAHAVGVGVGLAGICDESARSDPVAVEVVMVGRDEARRCE